MTVYLNQVGQPEECEMSSEQMFDDVHDAGELITQAIGAGSMCWENVRGAGEFDSTTAAAIADAAFRRLQMLLAERFSAEPTAEVGQTVRTKRGQE